MNIAVRWTILGYADVSVHTDNTRVALGLLDAKERQELAAHLREVADELSPVEEEG